MYDIEWAKIKNGANGFEELASEYVKDVFSFPYGRWEKTSTTHDGNKDAYTIIIGYHPNILEHEVWWMEAKYSAERIYLSRFKLDATIVSSIFNRSVKKIIFVTNIDIKAKVISDVRAALYNGTSCKEAYFCTKKALEFWLYKNPFIYKNFFSGPLPILSNSNDLFVSEDITIYSALNTMRDVSALHNIITNKLYEAHFKIVSNCNQKIKISSAQKGIKRLSTPSIDIHQGENILVIHFKIEDNFFDYKKHSIDGVEENNLCFFKINKNIPVITQYPLAILKNEKIQIKIESQIKFEQDFKKYKFRQQASYWLVDGTTGCGKTTLIQRCAEEKSIKDINYRYIKFTSNINTNNFELVSAMFFILFPYMYVEDITVEYLETLKISRYLKNVLCGLKKYITSEQELLNYIETLFSKETVLYPDEVQINPEIIVLDDVQLLNDNNIRLLFFILRTAQKLPIMFVLACHSYYMENSVFKLNKSQLAFERYHLELTVSDIIENMESHFSFTFDISNGLIEYFFPNVIVFNIYMNYVTELCTNIVNLDDFILSYISFKQGYISDEYINRQFMLISEQYPTAWKVCQEIYNYRNGISISNDNKNEIGHLLKVGLIKYNEFNNLIPINDIYIIHYRKKYICISDEKNPIENMIWRLTNMLLPDELECYYEKIHMMRSNEKFQTVNYILETVFENSSLDMYKRIWGEELFYLLYFEYTYAIINCNSMITGYDNLNYIYMNIKGTTSTRLGLLLLEIIFELINCDYNNSRYSNCKEYYEIFGKQFYVLAKKGDIESDYTKNLFWVLSTGYMLLIDAEEGSENAIKKAEEHRKFLEDNYPFHYINFCRQFSKALYILDWDMACKWQRLAYDAVIKRNDSVSKQALKVRFSFYFTQYLKTEDTNYLKKMQEQMSVAKHNIYSSYRHQLFLYCGLLYILDSLDEADTLLIKDVMSLRPIRQKMKGHYYLLLSLHFLKHQNIKDAKNNIEKSIKIFKGLKSYEYIVQHNSIVLKNVPLNKIQFKFCTSNTLHSDTFYLDPRM
ncbi:MAG: hypothetical protein HDR23_04955 [Lachnospiraceae bacterium]|nr:hypothetical protein [Lachnospiraceae bacterium]